MPLRWEGRKLNETSGLRERGPNRLLLACYRASGYKIFRFDPVGHGINPAVEHIELLHFLFGERARANASEHRDLVSCLIHAAVALEAARQAQRRRAGRKPGDQLRPRIRRETVEIR